MFKDSLPAQPSQIQRKPWCLPGHLLNTPPRPRPFHSRFSSAACSRRAERVSSGVSSQTGERCTGSIRQSPLLQGIRAKGERGWFGVIERQRLIRYYNILETIYGVGLDISREEALRSIRKWGVYFRGAAAGGGLKMFKMLWWCWGCDVSVKMLYM